MRLILGLLVLIGLFYLLTAPSRAVAELCRSHPVGSSINDIENLEEPFLVNRMGPSPDRDQPGAEYMMFCASTTMCDTSCRLTIKGGLVIESRFLAL